MHVIRQTAVTNASVSNEFVLKRRNGLGKTSFVSRKGNVTVTLTTKTEGLKTGILIVRNEMFKALNAPLSFLPTHSISELWVGSVQTDKLNGVSLEYPVVVDSENCDVYLNGIKMTLERWDDSIGKVPESATLFDKNGSMRPESRF